MNTFGGIVIIACIAITPVLLYWVLTKLGQVESSLRQINSNVNAILSHTGLNRWSATPRGARTAGQSAENTATFGVVNPVAPGKVTRKDIARRWGVSSATVFRADKLGILHSVNIKPYAKGMHGKAQYTFEEMRRAETSKELRHVFPKVHANLKKIGQHVLSESEKCLANSPIAG